MRDREWPTIRQSSLSCDNQHTKLSSLNVQPCDNQCSTCQSTGRWAVRTYNSRVTSVSQDDPEIESALDAKGGLVLPSLSHSHIHLDKCFVLDRCSLVTGDFAEALRVTNEAKAAFDADDLYRRGYKLIRDSLQCGVTSMRAHVEIDIAVQLLCLDVGLKLSNDFRGICDVQVAAFAQEPLFDGPAPGENYRLLEQAMQNPHVAVVGSAPYVESTLELAKANIRLVMELAQRRACHVDFHLDYNLDPSAEPLIFEVIKEAKRLSWSQDTRITIGHATRLQLFTPNEWHGLVAAIGDLPIVFVGLPQSDMYMLGRTTADTPLGAPRSTLRVPYIANKYHVEMAMSVNNVQNAFTPQGTADPFSLCTLGVALFQSATPEDIETLVRAVTLKSKEAIGMEHAQSLTISPGDPADFVIVHDTPDLQAAVLSPSYDRTVIKAGKVVARRETTTWFAET
ncbi:hypothetical protein FB45DRAFT_824055 [Roridomyces roridus]|uniref:Metallo-dependent hydrolase n=1 Tax=Roridomyces roridus TaxID=1738132 RepID=A0AAD7CB77_9AGAR|nr:hypothetical protein FB45DRAFT_824055 [Roridomyces roridus]